MNIAKEIAFYKNSINWPRWPLLPLKRIEGRVQDEDYLGMALDQAPTAPFKVYTGVNLFALPEIAAGLKQELGKHPSWREVLEKAGAKCLEYVTLEDLFRVWEID